MAAKIIIAHGNTQRLKRAVADLQGAGFEVTATPDGGDAFARFFEEPPDAVITSVSLPGLNGVNFARMVRSQSPETPVVLLFDPDEYELGSEAEEFTLLPDPLDVGALRELLPQLEVDAPDPDANIETAVANAANVFTLAALKRFQRGGSHILALLDEAGVQQMASVAQNQVRADGEQVICQGEIGDGFYLVVEGQVRVTLEERDNEEVARIGPGGFFGEMAMLSDQPRSANVWTVGETTLLWFDRASFLPMLSRYSSLREVLSGVALKRTEENLWRVLFADDEVQRSLAELDEAASTDSDDSLPPPGDSTASADDGRTQPPDESVQGPTTASPSDAAADGLALASSSEATDARQDASGAAPTEAATAMSPQMRRLFFAGIATGAGGGVALTLFAVLLIALLRSTPVQPAPAEPELAAITATADASGQPKEQAEQDEDEPADAADNPTSAPQQGADVADNPGPQHDADAAEPQPQAPKVEQPQQAKESGAAAAKAGTSSANAPEEPKDEAAIADRKEMRRAMVSAFKAGKYADAVKLGRALRQKYKIDWEAEFAIAEAERNAGFAEDAIASYRAFVASYPGNLYVDDAEFWLAELLTARGKKAEAKALYQRVAADDKSNFQTSAKARLEKF